MNGKVDKYPALTGKYEVKELIINRQPQHPNTCADSVLTVVYFDIKNGCVFQFNSPQKRWNGNFSKDGEHLTINWSSSRDKPVFNGTISQTDGSGQLMLNGMLGKDSVNISLEKLRNK